MSFDIHMYAECHDQDGQWKVSKPQQVRSQWDKFDWHPGQHYELFDVLAGFDFARINLQPLSKPRGLPGDVSKTVGQAAKKWDSRGAFGHSWFLVSELTAHDWDADEFKFFTTKFLPELTALGNPEHSRIVFWFSGG